MDNNKQATIQCGEKSYILHDGTESTLNHFINCRDGVIKRVKYHDLSGYGTYTEAFYARDTKAETCDLIIHRYIDGKIHEECLSFDKDSFDEFKKLFTEDAELFRTY